jgi:hypothetical protein
MAPPIEIGVIFMVMLIIFTAELSKSSIKLLLATVSLGVCTLALYMQSVPIAVLGTLPYLEVKTHAMSIGAHYSQEFLEQHNIHLPDFSHIFHF